MQSRMEIHMRNRMAMTMAMTMALGMVPSFIRPSGHVVPWHQRQRVAVGPRRTNESEHDSLVEARTARTPEDHCI